MSAISALLPSEESEFVHVNDAVLGARGRPEPEKLDLIGRLGGDNYCRTREVFFLRRPD